MTESLSAQIAAEYAGGATYRDIYRDHGVSSDALKRILRDHGIKRRPRGKWGASASLSARRTPCRHGLRYADGRERLCVMAGEDGACGLCIASVESVAGIRSAFDCEMAVGS